MTRDGSTKPAPAAIRNLGEPPEPPWLESAVEALEVLAEVRHGRRHERFGGIAHETVSACITAYLRRFTAAGTAPMLELTANDLVQWRVELGVPRLDTAAASRVLHAWHSVVATLEQTPNRLTAEWDEMWVTVRLRHQHHEQSHRHRFWVEVSIDRGHDVELVVQRQKDRTVNLGVLVANQDRKDRRSATTSDADNAPLGDALSEVGGFLGAFVRDANRNQLKAAHAVLRQGRREGWSRLRIILCIIIALATACGVLYWRVVQYTYSTAVVARPLFDWGTPEAIQPVFSDGERIGYVAYNHPAPDTVRLRYFRERNAWCPKHRMAKDIFTWRLLKDGREFYRTSTRSTPWCEIRRPDLPRDAIGIALNIDDGADITFEVARGGVVDLAVLQPEHAEPVVVVTTTEGAGDPPMLTHAQSSTTSVSRHP